MLKKRVFLNICRDVLKIVLVLGFVLMAGCSDADLGNGGDDDDAVEAPPEETRLFFNVFGDCKSGYPYYSTLISKALTAGIADLNFQMGDVIDDPEHYSHWSYFKSLSSPLEYNSEFHVVIGNHDVNDQASMNRMLSFFPRLKEKGYYSFLKDSVFFVILNSEEVGETGGLSSTQMTWLEAQLTSTEAQQSSAIVAFVHQPPFPQNKHLEEPLSNADEIHQLLVDNKVKILFSGHEHNYTHRVKDGVHYIITGGGGSPLDVTFGEDTSFYHFVQVSVLDHQLYLRIIDLFGRTRETIEIAL